MVSYNSADAGDILWYAPGPGDDDPFHTRLILDKATLRDGRKLVFFCQGYDPWRAFRGINWRYVVCMWCPYGTTNWRGVGAKGGLNLPADKEYYDDTRCSAWYGDWPEYANGMDVKVNPKRLLDDNPRRWHQLP